jgi:hypothetical protein
MGATDPGASGGITPTSLGTPSLTFIGGTSSGVTAVTAQSNETFLIANGANALIENFSPAGGDKLDLTALLSGAALNSDLSNLGQFVSVTGQSADPNGGTDTILSVSGPGGSASLALGGAGAISLSDLLNNNALVLPRH